ncbi:MAG TPA: rhodanese-like domain-containing protein, partial [Candidatus Saccharimonadales bacterium]|nr:rhodanese-like domain-containing protein [Candidatus Saccharimonadales bacterium]
SFGTWLGWTVEAERPIVLVVDGPDALDGLARQALRIGCASVSGYLHGGVEAWLADGRPVEAGGRLSIEQLATALGGDPATAPLVLDVRQATEYEAGHLPGAVHLTAGSLPDRLAELPRDRPIATICASGYRSSVAASVLRAAGFKDVAWVAQGVDDWDAAGYPTEHGPADASGDSPPQRGAADPALDHTTPHRH